MSKARWADGLRRGSTKTKTYSTLSTRKEGRVQIIKDRVYDVANPQTISQMQQRVIFGTVTSAAKHMYDLISISQEGETKPEYARQLFISQNVELLKRTIGKRVGLQNHYMSAFAPKGNDQLIPNSYQVSKGSLEVFDYFIPKTAQGESVGTTFQYGEWAAISRKDGDGFAPTLPGLTIGSTYTVAQLWKELFGLLPGDQLTFPQIAGDESAQVMNDGSNVVDKTLVTAFAAPRLVLKTDMPNTSVTITAETLQEDIRPLLEAGINDDSTYSRLKSQFLTYFVHDENDEGESIFMLDGNYNDVFGVLDGTIRAIGVILSRKDANGKWQYSTSNLCCKWDFISQSSGANYFGFTIDNAISTYLPSSQTDANGNFLQRGGNADIVPESFT